MFTNTHPATTLIVKSATLAQVQSEDKTVTGWLRMILGIWRERGGAGGAAVVIYFLMNLLVLVM